MMNTETEFDLRQTKTKLSDNVLAPNLNPKQDIRD